MMPTCPSALSTHPPLLFCLREAIPNLKTRLARVTYPKAWRISDYQLVVEKAYYCWQTLATDDTAPEPDYPGEEILDRLELYDFGSRRQIDDILKKFLSDFSHEIINQDLFDIIVFNHYTRIRVNGKNILLYNNQTYADRPKHLRYAIS